VTLQDALQRMGFAMDRTTVVFDAIDEPGMLRGITRPAADLRRELGVREGQLLALMAGHVREWKGQGAVLRGLALLPPQVRDRLVIAFAGGVSRGSEAYYAELQAFVEANGLAGSVRFLGERTDVPDLMNAADMVIHASTTPEPFGLVVLEGMLLGKLVLASRRGGPTEIIRPGTGVLFDPDAPEELARELSRAVLDEAARTSVGEAARTRAREFGPISRTAREVEALYQVPRVRRKLRAG
jgi:glycosyltransferase involved in cell wall biosynthesis